MIDLAQRNERVGHMIAARLVVLMAVGGGRYAEHKAVLHGKGVA